MSSLLRRLWDSPTFTTWSSTATRFLSVLLVLPLLLRLLSPAEIAIWYLLSTIIGLQTLADMGFAPTFTRLIAYGMGGAKSAGDGPKIARPDGGTTEPNWDLIEAVWGTMRSIYGRLTVVAVVMLGALGTWALVRPMAALADPTTGWMSWVVVLAVSGTVLWANAYAAYLQGVNQIALLRRWEALTSIGAILTSFVVLLAGGRLLSLVIANQVWALVSVIRNWQLCCVVNGARFQEFRRAGIDPEVFRVAWPSAWRSGVGISFSRGVLYASGLIYAQVAEATALSAYLLAFRFIQMISELSQAPFYSKIPMLARLRFEGRFDEQLAVARRGMRLAYWTYVTGFVGVAVLASPLLQAVGSNVPFADPRLWALLGLGFFVERYGAMHIQLYSTTNHIIWHVANGVTGIIYLTVSLSLLRSLGVYAFPVGVLAGYLGFYSWYAARHVYKAFDTTFLSFERSVAVPAAVPVLLSTFWAFIR